MKAVVTLFITSIMLLSCTKDETVFIEETRSSELETIMKTKLYDENEVPITTKYLKEKWQKELTSEGNPQILGDFEIITSFDDNGRKYFFLKAISVDGSIETAAFKR